MKTRMHRFWLSLALTAGSMVSPFGSNSWAHDWPVSLTGESISKSTWNFLLDNCFETGIEACPAESVHGPIEPSFYDEVLSRNALSKYTKEITCWVNDWERQQPQPASEKTDPIAMFAALPDQGQAPMPSSSQTRVHSLVSADTCHSDADYRSTKNVDPADATLSDDCRWFSSPQDEAMPCQPSRFAPGIVDEYMAYDVGSHDAHWLSKYSKTLSNPTPWIPVPADLPGRSESDYEMDEAELPRETAATDSVFSAEFDEEFHPTYEYQLSDPFESPSTSENDGSLRSAVNAATDAVDRLTCELTAELCGFEHASNVGATLGDWSLWGVRATIANLIVFGHSIDASFSKMATKEPNLDLLVVYTDVDGATIMVPSTLARAWNRPEFDQLAEKDGQWLDSVSEDRLHGPAWFDKQQLTRQLLSFAVSKLDAMGLALLQAADYLSNWVEPQVASREDAEIR